MSVDERTIRLPSRMVAVLNLLLAVSAWALVLAGTPQARSPQGARPAGAQAMIGRADGSAATLWGDELELRIGGAVVSLRAEGLDARGLRVGPRYVTGSARRPLAKASFDLGVGQLSLSGPPGGPCAGPAGVEISSTGVRLCGRPL